MKKFLLNSKSITITLVIVTLFLFSTSASFAAVKTWNGGTGVGLNWTTGTNWVGGIAPVAGDDIVFNTPGTITFSTMPAASVAYNSLTISDGVVTLAGAANITLTIGNAAGLDFSIAGIGSLTIGTNVSITLANAATATISGSFIINAGRTYNTNGTVVSTVFGTITNNGVLTCTTASKLLMQAGSAYVHNQDGGTIPTGTWNTTSTCNIKGAVTTSLAGGGAQAFGNLTYDCAGMTGAITMTAGLSVTGNFEVINTGSSILQMTAGSFTVSGNCTIQDDFRIANTSDRTLTVNGNVFIQGGTLDMCNGAGGDVGTIDANGNFSHTGGTITETGTGSGLILFSKTGTQTYTSGGTVTNTVNYTVNSGATLQMATDATTITGAGTFTLSAGATLGITSPDGITTVGTALGNILTTTGRTYNVGANYMYNGSASQNTGSGFPTALTGDLIINNSGTVSLSAARTIANGGLVNLTAGSLNAGVNLTMLATSTITRSEGIITGTLQGTAAYNVTYTGNTKTTGIELANGGLNIVTVNLTAGQILTLNATTSPDGNLTVSAGTFDLGTFTINKSGAAGTLTVSSGAKLIIGGTNSLPTNYAYTFGGTSTIEYAGANQAVVSTTYGHVIASGSGNKTVSAAAATDINGNLTIASGVTLSVGAANFTVDLTTAVNGTLAYSSTTGTKTFNGPIDINAGGSWDNAINEGITLNGGLDFSGTTFTAGTGIYLFDADQTISGLSPITIPNLTVNSGGDDVTNSANLTITASLIGGGELINGATGVLNINFTGAVGITTLTASAAGNIVNYGFNGAQTIRGIAYQNLTLSGINTPNVKTLGAATTANVTLSMQGNASLALGAFALTYATTSTLEYAGSVAQTSTNIEYPATNGPGNLRINNANGFNLHASRSLNRTASSALTLTNGILTIPTGIILTISRGTVIGGTGFDATKHIATLVNTGTGAKGFLQVDSLTANVAYVFPTGNGTLYLPVTLTPSNATVASNDYSVCVFPGITTNGQPNGTGFSPAQKNNCVDAVWTVNYNGPGTPTASATNMIVGWPASLEGINFPTYIDPIIGIAHYDGTPGWGPVVGDGDNTANTATRTGVTSFSPFGVGKEDPSGGVLAIKITYFNASKGNGYNTVNWQASCSSSQAIFEVERSTDGINFYTITNVTASQARCAQPFNYQDNTATAGTVYYRLKAIDVDGKASYSLIVKLGNQTKDIQLVGIAPNPVDNLAQVKINTNKKDIVDLSIVSLDGRVVYHSSVQLQPGSSVISLDISNLAGGMYMIKGLFSDGQTNTLKFTKQ